MDGDGKEMMLNAAVNIGKFYAFLAQELRGILDPEVAAQLPEGVLDIELTQTWAHLAPLLEKNPVVKDNLETVYQRVMRIRKNAQDEATRNAGLREAKDYLVEVAERARTVSDLVGLFRRL